MNNFLIESKLLYVLITVVIIILIGVIYIIKLNTQKDRKLELIIGLTAGVSIILVMYSLILTTHSNIQIEKSRNATTTLENIQRNWLSPQIELSQSYPEGFFLYKSITPDADHGNTAPIEYDPAKRAQIEIATSIRIFQAIEDYLTLGSHDLTGSNVWINNFLMWMQSPILRKNWKSLSFNYSIDTRKLIERLISESNKLIHKREKKGILTSEDYDHISTNFEVTFR